MDISTHLLNMMNDDRFNWNTFIRLACLGGDCTRECEDCLGSRQDMLGKVGSFDDNFIIKELCTKWFWRCIQDSKYDKLNCENMKTDCSKCWCLFYDILKKDYGVVFECCL